MTCANHPDRENSAFCQNCGKPLCPECTRTIGSAVFCEQCLAAKIGAPIPPAPGAAYSYTDPASGASFSGTQPTPGAPGSYTYVDPASGINVGGVLPRSGAPNPWLAAFLGFIPGVGAMYNEQYAKGVIHLVVFAILVSLSDNNGIFGLFVAGWEFYMAIEAHHTARARRDGLPLPNPFGLNDIGERLGFGKSWGTANTPVGNPYVAPTVPPAAASTAVPPYAPPYTAGFVPPVPPPAWGVPQPGYPDPAYPGYGYPPAPTVPLDETIAHPGTRFPAGAIWLIVLGAIFLIGNSGVFHWFSAKFFVPLLLIALAVWIFLRKLTSKGAYSMSDDGSSGYQIRVYRALRGSAWIALVGVLFLLDDCDILSWSHSWPLFIILWGVMTVMERAVYANAANPAYGAPYGYPGAPTAPPPPAPVEPASTSIVPVEGDDLRDIHRQDHQDGSNSQEGR
jgi:hypothetical protein